MSLWKASLLKYHKLTGKKKKDNQSPNRLTCKAFPLCHVSLRDNYTPCWQKSESTAWHPSPDHEGFPAFRALKVTWGRQPNPKCLQLMRSTRCFHLLFSVQIPAIPLPAHQASPTAKQNWESGIGMLLSIALEASQDQRHCNNILTFTSLPAADVSATCYPLQ